MLDTGHFYLRCWHSQRSLSEPSRPLSIVIVSFFQIEYAPSVFIRSLNIWLECAHNIAQKRVE